MTMMSTFTHRILFAAGLVVAAAALETRPKIALSSPEAVLEAKRELQATRQPCGEPIGAMIECYATECATEFCDIEPGVTPERPDGAETSSCDTLTNAFCSSFDSTCCAPCAAKTQAYLDCLVENSFLQLLCPGASCREGGESINQLELPSPGSNSNNSTNATSSEPQTDAFPDVGDATEIPDADVDVAGQQAGDDWLSSTCGIHIAMVFNCYLTECNGRECEGEIEEVDSETPAQPSIGDCEGFTEAFCDAFNAANECCPECIGATSAYSDCALQEQVSLFCPDASCSVAAEKIGVSAPVDPAATTDQGKSLATPKMPETGVKETEASGKIDAAYTASSGARLVASGAVAVLGLVSLSLML